jgi:tetratricopeptide (TPR) repeat protein
MMQKHATARFPRVTARSLGVKPLAIALTACMASGAFGQFVYPKPDYHNPEPGIYTEDPFITHYRQEFFAVFKGDIKRFEKAYAEIKEMVAKDPKDPRALVWLGNGDTVKAGTLWLSGKKEAALALLETSRTHLDEALAMRPDDPNIFMMHGVTLYIQGQYFAGAKLPDSVWKGIRTDCEHLIRYFGPKITKVSIHVRGETYGELGIACLKLGDKKAAKAAFEKILKLDPGTDYATRATKELAAL